MDEVIINLPCGFETTYGSLRTGEPVKRCLMCDEEDLVVEDILRKPRNRMRLKERELEIEIENLRKLNQKLSTVKQSYEQIFNELDLRREEVKREFEKKLDNYYTKLRRDYEAEKSAIQKLKSNQEKIDFNY